MLNDKELQQIAKTASYSKDEYSFKNSQVLKNEKGRLRDDQKRFKKLVENMPVLYGVCRSVEDALKIVEG